MTAQGGVSDRKDTEPAPTYQSRGTAEQEGALLQSKG
jgi:hypothetical protein